MTQFDPDRFIALQQELLDMGIVLENNSLWCIDDVDRIAEWAGVDISKMSHEEKLNLLANALEHDIIAETVNDCIKNELNDLPTT